MVSVVCAPCQSTSLVGADGEAAGVRSGGLRLGLAGRAVLGQTLSCVCEVAPRGRAKKGVDGFQSCLAITAVVTATQQRPGGLAVALLPR
jgi:hypothetical protein